MDSNFDPLDQISLLKEKCNNISPLIYRAASVYLEELRNLLPQTIRTTLFSFITDRPGDDFGFSTFSSRKLFQLKIDKLVSDNISLITIEHLIELAKKIDQENIRHLSNLKNEMSNVLNLKDDSKKSEPLSTVNSIHISSIPPLENLSIIEGWNGELKAPYAIDNNEIYMKSTNTENEFLMKNTNKEYDQLKEDDKNTDTFNIKSKDFEVLQSIFALTDESNSTDLDTNTDDFYESSSSDDVIDNRFLPQSPIGLYEWIVSIDTALIRRLRDVSDSINTELLKSGIVNTLIPINILDAALSGQLISSKSISNILTFKLPTNNPLVPSGGLDIDCLLITPWDMEFDNPRLRKNRTNIKHYQNVLLGMIKQQRYWEGRSLAEEVNREWWKDTTKI